MKNLKFKLVLTAFSFVVSIFVSLFFSFIIHFQLKNGSVDVGVLSIKRCIESVMSDEQHLALFLVLNLIMLLLGVLLVFSNKRGAYDSEMKVITPLISTPIAAGQNQHGSAKWLDKSKVSKVFAIVSMQPKSERMKELIDRGYDSVEDKNKAVQEEETIAESNGDKDDLVQEEEENVETKEDGEKLAQEEGEVAETNEESIVKKAEDPFQVFPKGGIVLGMNKTRISEQCYFIEDDTHTLCIGATRSGKSRTVVLQSIGLQALAGESMVISDPKAELHNYTYPFLERLGYDVIPIDFKNPLKSRRYNFLQNVIDAFKAKDLPRAIDYVWDITESLVGNNASEPIWDDGQKSVIAAAIMSVVYDNMQKPQYQNLTNVYHFLAEMCKPVGKTLPLNKYLKQLDSQHPAKALLGISEVAPSKTRGSFFTAALTTLRLFTNPLIYSMTCVSDFDHRITGKDKQAIFLILPDEKETYYTLASLFTSQHYETLVSQADERGGRLERRVNFNLDEFGNYAQIPAFTTKLTVGGGRGIRFNLFVQSLSQLDEKYNKENAKTIKSNCETWIYLQSDDLETLEEVSKKLGNYTVATNSRSSSYSRYSPGSESESVNLTGRALLTPDEVRLIGRPYSLITSRNLPCMIYAPDISGTYFNALFGMGNREHNTKLQKEREDKRLRRSAKFQVELWGVWNQYNGTMEKYFDEFPVLDSMKKKRKGEEK